MSPTLPRLLRLLAVLVLVWAGLLPSGCVGAEPPAARSARGGGVALTALGSAGTPPPGADTAGAVGSDRWSDPALQAREDGLPPQTGTLSLLVQRQWQDYLARPEPLAFAVSATGRYAAYRFCEVPGACGAGDAGALAVQDCEAHRLDSPCGLVALGAQPGALDRWRPEAGLELSVVPGDGTVAHPPLQASGILLYFPGYDAWAWPPAPDNGQIPPYALALNRLGWDVRVVNIPYYNRHPMMLPDIAPVIRQLAAEARAAGFGRIAMAGQSRGAWELMLAADWSLDVDALILTAPAAHGTANTYDGGVNAFFQRARREFQTVLAGFAPRRAAIFLFDFDLYDPGGRADLLRQVLAPLIARGDALVVSQPPRLRGHAAASEEMFARLFAPCLDQFARGWPTDCTPDLAGNPVTGPLDVTSLRQVQEAGWPRLRGADLILALADRQFRVHGGTDPGALYQVAADGAITVLLPGRHLLGPVVNARWVVEDDQFCVLDSPVHTYRRTCYQVFQAAPGVLLRVRPDGSAGALTEDWQGLTAQTGH